MADRLIRNDRGATPMEWGLSPAATPLSLRWGRHRSDNGGDITFLSPAESRGSPYGSRT